MHTIRTWLPLAVAATILSLTIYVVAQQGYREGANDPQIELAEAAVENLAAGNPPAAVVPAGRQVDISESLAPFVTVFDSTGKVLASSATLHSEPLRLPQGVLDYVRASGEERVTWQPEAGVRIAAVVRRYDHLGVAGFVLAGRSLRLAEERTERLGTLVLLGLGAALVGSLIGALAASSLKRS